jgi:hypothetical protein
VKGERGDARSARSFSHTHQLLPPLGPSLPPGVSKQASSQEGRNDRSRACLCVTKEAKRPPPPPAHSPLLLLFLISKEEGVGGEGGGDVEGGGSE